MPQLDLFIHGTFDPQEIAARPFVPGSFPRCPELEAAISDVLDIGRSEYVQEWYRVFGPTEDGKAAGAAARLAQARLLAEYLGVSVSEILDLDGVQRIRVIREWLLAKGETLGGET